MVRPARPPEGVSGRGSNVRSVAAWLSAGAGEASKPNGVRDAASNKRNKCVLMTNNSQTKDQTYNPIECPVLAENPAGAALKGRAASLPPAVAEDQSAPNFTFDRTAYRAHNNRTGCNHDRPRPQNDAGPYDATDRIFNVLAVYHGTGLFSACDYEPSDQQRRQGEGKFHFSISSCLELLKKNS